MAVSPAASTASTPPIPPGVGAAGLAGALAQHLAFLQLELADPEFHQHVLEHARVARGQTRLLLDAAIEHGELGRCDTGTLAEAIQVAYNGMLITWAIFRQGPLGAALRVSSNSSSGRTVSGEAGSRKPSPVTGLPEWR